MLLLVTERSLFFSPRRASLLSLNFLTIAISALARFARVEVEFQILVAQSPNATAFIVR